MTAVQAVFLMTASIGVMIGSLYLAQAARKMTAAAQSLAAQAQATTAHAALLSGSVDQLRRDLSFPDDLKFLEGDL